MSSSAKSPVRRATSVRCIGSFMADSLSNLPARAPDGRDGERVVRVCIQFGAQALDMRIHRAVIARELIPPNDCQQVIPREHAPRRRGQRVQQLDLPPRQVQLVPGQRDGQRRQVNRTARRSPAFPFPPPPGCAAAPRESAPSPRRGKRLDDVIVRADIQPENPIRVLVLGGNHQNRHARHPADAAADLQPVQPPAA